MAGLPRFHWPAAGVPARRMSCPQCEAADEKPVLVSIGWHTRDNPDRRNDVLSCPSCGAAFYDDRTPPDYTDPNIAEQGRAEFYLQQGTGLWQSAGLLARIRRPAGTRYIEVGCGLGFGLDFAIHGLGWDGHGFDPSPIAAEGGARLSLPIVLDYFSATEPDSCDVLMAAEVIEHVPSPREFLLMLANALAADGMLVLTTPDAAAISPGTPSGALVPLLSPGLHLILQSERSLATLLAECGFGHVAIERDSYSLVAFASRAPLDLGADRAAARALYRDWLRKRAATAERDPGLYLAFAGHALWESVNDSDLATARAIAPALAACLEQQFGIAIDAPLPLRAEIRTSPLAGLADLMPLNLPAILFARAIMRLHAGERRAEVRPLFAAAAEAAGALRRALAERMLEDGETEDLAWTAAAEALLCDAEVGAPGLLARLADLPAAPGEKEGAERRRDIARRALVGLVNAGHYVPGRALARAEGLDREGETLLAPGPLSVTRRDMLFALAMLELQKGGDPARASSLFARVRSALETEGVTQSDLYRASRRGEAAAAAQHVL
ncbi:MAG TPA: methyltransferase domain-containing protein [Acetobacteraceae bacterium]|nr:methyltransferase domain-containing protein [Acetobacteraceae bacterium]